MTTSGTLESERRNQTRDIVNKLLAERKQLLALLFNSSSSNPVASVIERERLREFCQILVDYIAAGHFGLYQRLSDGLERRTAVLKVAEQVFPSIQAITANAVAFNDHCEANNYQRTDEVMENLSELAEELSTRFELEDQVIEAMM